MKPKALGIVLGLAVAMVGCSLTETGSRDVAPIPRIGSKSKAALDHLATKRVTLKMVVASRPEADPALGVAIWQVADEQAIESEARRALQANGLRVGRVSGDLPTEVEAVLHAPPPRKVEILTIVIPEGEPTLIDPGTAPIDSLNLILDQKGWPVGKIYQEAHGFARVTASYDGKEGVALRILPELHHGPVRKDWEMAAGATPLTPKQLVMKNGQQEETFRDLAATVVVQPGEVAVLGARPERRGSLGQFLYSEQEANSDRPLRKVVFIWASRSQSGDVPPDLTPVDPPKQGA